MSKRTILRLPIRAVSQNTFWGHTRGGMKYITQKGRIWRDTIQILVRKALKKGEAQWHDKDPLQVEYIFYLKTKRKIDTFNMEKPLTDSLQGLLFVDDEQIKKGIVSRVYETKEDRIYISITTSP